MFVLYRTAVSLDPESLRGPSYTGRMTTMRTDGATQSAVRRAVQAATGPDERLQVTHTVATHGWGDVLYVDVYARSRGETLGDLNPELRRAVAVVADQPYERVSIKWRLAN
jgi:hypothetical protein